MTDAMVVIVPMTLPVGMGLRHSSCQRGERSRRHQSGEQYSFHLVHLLFLNRSDMPFVLLLSRCDVTGISLYFRYGTP